MLLAFGVAYCSGPTEQRLYAERYPMRRTPSHNFFARLHRRLAETVSFQRSAMNRGRSARTPNIEENVLHQQVLPQLLGGEQISASTRQIIWFQQDGAPAHFNRNVRNHPDVIFDKQWIGRGGPVQWPARSPDLSCLDFFLWGAYDTG
ncbi:hypothetical protein AVEN_145906-1 [Araneus ventricosus]|uniref:DUF4817 domain-containing protein n=1 Tax=Araneus ventricosus TaxID=182803 RepID=A0A4Y2U6B8_ARAVE|nr:hypothetical protein AVEN_139389-1 [Araneus ventricosus]GBO08528.1 hypothetical protein AVEN_145906-1 [Araneus ventricosus]